MKVLLFGGTIEGRKLAEAIAVSLSRGLDISHCSGIELCHVCVATEYGASLLPKNEKMIIHHDRMDAEAISELIKSVGFDICIDATHPYAELVSRNIKEACDDNGVKLYRVLRDNVSLKRDSNADIRSNADSFSRIKSFDSIHDAVSYLKGTKGNILTSTGSKELKEFTAIDDYRIRVYARVLPVKEVVAACEELGFAASNLYCMQGPFSVEMNIAMINACKAEHIVTKASGSAGGFDEKYEAAMSTGAELIIIGRPKEVSEDVYSLEEVYEVLGVNEEIPGKINNDLNTSISDIEYYVNQNSTEKSGKEERDSERRAYIIGTGCGDIGLLTLDALRAIRDSSCVIGAARMIDNLKQEDMLDKKDILISYSLEEIGRYLRDNKPDTVALLYSGDIGFYSGANGVEDALSGYSVVRIPGISSGVYFCDKLGIPWQDVRFISCHGRELDIKKETESFDKLLILLGKEKDAGEICNELCKLKRDKARVFIGERLSYNDENITKGSAEELKDIITDPLAVMLVLCPKKGI